MKKVLCLLAVLSLIGCKSINDVREGKPDSVFKTSKSSDIVSECILYGWQEKSYIDGPMKAYLQPFPKGKTVYTENYIEVADVTSLSNNGSEIKFFSQGRYHRAEMRDVIKSCL